MRTLLIAENLPYPALKGGDLRTWQNVNALLALGEVAVFGLCSNDRRRAAPPSKGLRLWRSCGDPALASPPPEEREVEARSWIMTASGHPSDVYYSEAAATELARVAAELRPDVVVIERLWLQGYIEVFQRLRCPVILDDHNVEGVLQEQMAASACARRTLPRAVCAALVARTREMERRAVAAVDQVWVCSAPDAAVLRERYGSETPVRVVPNTVDVEHYRPAPDAPRRDARSPSLVFPAMFGHAPNAVAAEFLIDRLLPRLRGRWPDCRIELVGGMPTPAMLRAAAADPEVVVTGTVPDVRPHLARASAVVVPLFEGSGTRLKILEAFATGVPVVSTARGAEGICAAHEKHLLIAEDTDGFAAAVGRLLEDPELGRRLSRNALDCVRKSYSWDVARSSIASAVRAIPGLATKAGVRGGRPIALPE